MHFTITSLYVVCVHSGHPPCQSEGRRFAVGASGLLGNGCLAHPSLHRSLSRIRVKCSPSCWSITGLPCPSLTRSGIPISEFLPENDVQSLLFRQRMGAIRREAFYRNKIMSKAVPSAVHAIPSVPRSGHLFLFCNQSRNRLKNYSGMATDFGFARNDWNGVASAGRKRKLKAIESGSPTRNSRCFWEGLIWREPERKIGIDTKEKT